MRLSVLSEFLILSLAVSAQNFGVDTNEITFYGHPDSLEFNDGFFVQNYSGQFLNMAWQRSAETLPVGWEASICDGVACRPPEVDFALYELDTVWNSPLNIMHMYYYPHGIPGMATTHLKVFQWDTTSSDTVHLTFHGVAIGSLSTEKYPEVVLKTYPVPAKDIVTIIISEEVNVRSIRLLDMRGSELKTSYTIRTDRLVLQLPALIPGKYFVQFEHERGTCTVPILKE